MNKRFIHSPVRDKARFPQEGKSMGQDLGLIVIEIGLWIKRGCAKPIEALAGAVALYGDSIRTVDLKLSRQQYFCQPTSSKSRS
jgi:hypothetical protein